MRDGRALSPVSQFVSYALPYLAGDRSNTLPAGHGQGGARRAETDELRSKITNLRYSDVKCIFKG